MHTHTHTHKQTHIYIIIYTYIYIYTDTHAQTRQTFVCACVFGYARMEEREKSVVWGTSLKEASKGKSGADALADVFSLRRRIGARIGREGDVRTKRAFQN